MKKIHKWLKSIFTFKGHEKIHTLKKTVEELTQENKLLYRALKTMNDKRITSNRVILILKSELEEKKQELKRLEKF